MTQTPIEIFKAKLNEKLNKKNTDLEQLLEKLTALGLDSDQIRRDVLNQRNMIFWFKGLILNSEGSRVCETATPSQPIVEKSCGNCKWQGCLNDNLCNDKYSGWEAK